MLPQELFMQKIKILQPNAIFSCRPYDNNETIVLNPIIVGDYLLDWDQSNASPPPALQDINAVQESQIEDMVLGLKRIERNKRYSHDLSIKSLYKIELVQNPELSFDDFLDILESDII